MYKSKQRLILDKKKLSSRDFIINLFNIYLPNVPVECVIINRKKFSKMFGKSIAAGTIEVNKVVVLFASDDYISRRKVSDFGIAILLHEIGHYMNPRITINSNAAAQEVSAHKWAIKESASKAYSKVGGERICMILVTMLTYWLKQSTSKYKNAAKILLRDKQVMNIVKHYKILEEKNENKKRIRV